MLLVPDSCSFRAEIVSFATLVSHECLLQLTVRGPRMVIGKTGGLEGLWFQTTWGGQTSFLHFLRENTDKNGQTTQFLLQNRATSWFIFLAPGLSKAQKCPAETALQPLCGSTSVFMGDQRLLHRWPAFFSFFRSHLEWWSSNGGGSLGHLFFVWHQYYQFLW